MTNQILPGVPASVPRSKVVALVEGLGLDVTDLLSLEFSVDGIFAEVYADRDADRRERTPGERAMRFAVGDVAATHRVCIRITNEPDEKASGA